MASSWPAIRAAAIRDAAVGVLTDPSADADTLAAATSELEQGPPMTAGEALAGMSVSQLYALRAALQTIFPS